MTPEQGYALAADAILFLHTLVVLFVAGGLLALLIGGLRRWRWVRNPWFRYLHLSCIGVVALQSWLGVLCPLTQWEMALRSRAGDAVYSGSFIGHWLNKFLYYNAPEWLFIALYTLVAAITVVAWWRLPPHPFNRSGE